MLSDGGVGGGVGCISADNVQHLSLSVGRTFDTITRISSGGTACENCLTSGCAGRHYRLCIDVLEFSPNIHYYVVSCR